MKPPARPQALVRWAARIWSILVMLLAAMILLLAGLGTGGSGLPPIEVLGLAAYALALVGLAVAWRWEALGGALTLLGAATSSAVMISALGFSLENLLFPGLFTAGPGVLFLISWMLAKRKGRRIAPRL